MPKATGTHDCLTTITEVRASGRCKLKSVWDWHWPWNSFTKWLEDLQLCVTDKPSYNGQYLYLKHHCFTSIVGNELQYSYAEISQPTVLSLSPRWIRHEKRCQDKTQAEGQRKSPSFSSFICLRRSTSGKFTRRRHESTSASLQPGQEQANGEERVCVCSGAEEHRPRS